MNEQHTLMQAIFNTDSAETSSLNIDPRGLKIYQRNLIANAVRALSITFPTVLTLVGDELFAHAVEQLIRQDPPQTGDWGQWGESFPRELKQLSALQAYPYVADVAELDFSLHQLGRAQDTYCDLTSMSLLADCAMDELRLVLNPTLHLLAAEYPIIDIYQANHAPSNDIPHFLQQAQAKLIAGVGQVALLYRPQFKPLIRAIEPSEYDWLILMQKNFSLGEALDTLAYRKQAFSFEQWLPLAVQHNLISHLETV